MSQNWICSMCKEDMWQPTSAISIHAKNWVTPIQSVPGNRKSYCKNCQVQMYVTLYHQITKHTSCGRASALYMNSKLGHLQKTKQLLHR